jgi:hypothetical protein
VWTTVDIADALEGRTRCRRSLGLSRMPVIVALALAAVWTMLP